MKRTNFRLSQESNIEPANLQINASIDGYIETTNHPYTSIISGYYMLFNYINNLSPLLPPTMNTDCLITSQATPLRTRPRIPATNGQRPL